MSEVGKKFKILNFSIPNVELGLGHHIQGTGAMGIGGHKQYPYVVTWSQS